MTDEPIVNPEWEPITRAWLLTKVEEVNRVELAREIFATLNEEYVENDKIQVVRADVVCGPFDLIIPVFTEYGEELETIITKIMGFKGVVDVQVALVLDHVPFPTQNTKGFVTYQEENSPIRGPRGHSPW